MATLAVDQRIGKALVTEETERLANLWRTGETTEPSQAILEGVIEPAQLKEIDRFDRVQLAEVISVCRESKSLSGAGRELFAASRIRRKATNDSDRVRKYLAKFGLDWNSIQ
jgi:transcriptional regulatory protein RtcR